MHMEIFINHPEYTRYKISNFGNVKGINGCLMKLPLCGGYQRITIITDNGAKINKTVHSLVLRTFIGVCPVGYVRNHKDHNKLNNHIDNLEYCTQKENIRQANDRGLMSNFGEKNSKSKLTLNQVRDIRDEYIPFKNGYGKIAKKYNVSRSCIQGIINIKTRYNEL